MTLSRLIRHAGLGAAGLAATWVLYRVMPTDLETRAATVASAFTSLGYLALALSIGPIRVLRGRPPVRHMELRRDLGIWAGVLGLIHVLFGLQVHFGGDWRQYFVHASENGSGLTQLRFDLIGVANWVGLVATLVLIVLLATSNNGAMRSLGVARWKSVQRSVYLLVATLAIHGMVYQVLTNRPWPAVALLWLTLLWIGALQATAFARHRRGMERLESDRGQPNAAV